MTEALKLIKEESTRPRSGLLRELNLFGYEKIEDVIIAALVTGDPLLLVGTHGTAKTMLCENIAKAMGKRFIAYDASKALFEDVLGFPNPYSMEKGEIDYISTPISIQGKEFVLIDEISRANYQLQGKWLEVIRSRRIMGKKIEGLHYIFGAMNPPSYVGARTLDAALSGRFAFIVEAPDFSALDAEAKESVLDNVSEDDAVVLNGSVGPRSFASSSLQEIVGMAKELYQSIGDEYSGEIRKLVLALEKHLTAQNFVFDGRRAGMVKRGLTAILSVRAAKGVEIAEGLHATFRECLPHLLPYSVEMDDFNPDTLSTLLEDLFRELYGMTVEKDDMIRENHSINKLVVMIEREASAERKIAMIRRLYSMPLGDAAYERLCEFHQEYFSDCDARDFMGIFAHSQNYTRPGEVKLLSPEETCAIRLGFRITNSGNFRYQDQVDDIPRLREILMKGGSR